MQPYKFDEILQDKAEFRKYLMEKCFLDHYLHISFKYIVKLFFLISKLLQEVS